MSRDVALARTRWGVLACIVDDYYQSQSIMVYGEYSPDEWRLLRNLVSSGDIVIDAGANQGFLTVALAEFVGPDGRVMAFEPQPELCGVLKYNCLSRANVDVRQQALGSTCCHTKIPSLASGLRSAEEFLSRSGVSYDNMLINYGHTVVGSGEFDVDMITIDSLGLERCDLIKADVEGHEARLIIGAAETIRRCCPVLYIENDKPESALELVSTIQELDYECYWHRPPMFSLNNYNEQSANIFGDTKSTNMICLPPTMRLPLENPIPRNPAATDMIYFERK